MEIEKSSRGKGKKTKNAGGLKPPKRFRTAYNFFFMHERENILNSQSNYAASSEMKDGLSSPSKSSPSSRYTKLTPVDAEKMLSKTEKRKHVWAHGKISFKTMTEMVSSKWRTLSREERQVFDRLACEDLARYRRELKEYDDKLSSASKIPNQKIDDSNAMTQQNVSNVSALSSCADNEKSAKMSLVSQCKEEEKADSFATVRKDPTLVTSKSVQVNPFHPNQTASPPCSLRHQPPSMAIDSLTNMIVQTQHDFQLQNDFQSDTPAGIKEAPMNILSNVDFISHSEGGLKDDGNRVDDISVDVWDNLEEIESLAMESFPVEDLTLANITCGSLAMMSISVDDSNGSNGSVIYESLTTRIFRLSDPEGKFGGNTGFLALKMSTDQFPCPRYTSRLENEYRVSQYLSQCNSTRSALLHVKHHGSNAMYLEWVIGANLREWVRSAHGINGVDLQVGGSSSDNLQTESNFDYVNALHLALQISEALSDIHNAGVVHNNLTAENIIIRNDAKNLNYSAKIIDLGCASILEKNESECTSHKRADLLSLGAVFFELFSGINPFKTHSGNSIHDDGRSSSRSIQGSKITKGRPFSDDLYSLLTSKAPLCISTLVLNLMRKIGNNYHYHTAKEVSVDLNAMINSPQQLLFGIGCTNAGRLMLRTDKLYGRDEHLNILMNAYERVSQREGRSEMVLVTGYSGAGKSTLVDHFSQCLFSHSINFLKGKFDQFQEMEPLSAIISAFTSLCEKMMTTDGENLREIKASVLESVGSSGAFLENLMPCLHEMIGTTGTSLNEAVKVGGIEAQNRFKYVFRLFVRALVSPTQPLVLYLDDLQWADPASLGLIATLITDTENSSLLLIGSYRENEVDDSHPLNSHIQQITKNGVPIDKIKVDNLSKTQVNELISDSLQMSQNRTQPLTDIVYRKTCGNALFVRQFLKSILDDGLLRYLFNTKQWQWDTESIESRVISDNAIGLMSQQILNFPKMAQFSLQVVACLGSVCEELIQCLTSSRNTTLENIKSTQCYYACNDDLLKWLDFSVDEGLLDCEGSKYKFAHDQIQLATYSLIPEEERGLWHLQIGDQIRKTMTSDKALYVAVGQLNRGAPYITEKEERIQLAGLNLQAGEKAVSSSVFSLAGHFFETGIDLLDEKCWKEHYDLSLNLHTNCAEACYSIGRFEKMEQVLDELFVSVRSFHDKGKAYCTQIQALAAQNKVHEAFKAGLFLLEKLGESFAASPDQDVINTEFAKTKEMIEAEKTDVLDLCQMEDEQKMFVMKVASIVLPYSNCVKSSCFCLIALRMVQLSLMHGACNYSADGFAACSFCLSSFFDDIGGATNCARLALRLLDRSHSKEHMARTYVLVYSGIYSWVEHLHLSLQPLKNAYEVGMRCGDVQSALLCVMQYCIHLYRCGEDLKTVAKATKRYGDQMLEYKQIPLRNVVQVFRQTALNMMGRCEDPVKLTGEAMDQESLLKSANERDPNLAFVIYKNCSWLAYSFGNLELASQMAEKAQLILDEKNRVVTFSICSHAFVRGLTSFSLARETGDIKWQSIGNESLKKMENWARYASSNCQDKLILLKAESAFVSGQYVDAAKYFDMAINETGEKKFVQEQALSYERAGIFYLAQGDTIKASQYYGKAHDAYLRWGAKGKADHLRINSPF